MSSHYLLGVALLVGAAVLMYLGLPNKNGEPAKFLRFEAAPLLYPPLIIALIAGSIASFLWG